jgi:hypothetical protein
MTMRLVLAGLALAPLAQAQASWRVEARNPLTEARTAETLEVTLAQLAPLAAADLPLVVVVDETSGREVLSQAVDTDGDHDPDTLIFQADFAASQARVFTLRKGERRKPRAADFRAGGRFVRERHDDFAWENDRVAFRVYGEALETWQREPLTSSTIDAWSKRTPRLVQDEWYRVDDYHRDHGEGGDFYSAGTSRGCGGGGLLVSGELHVTRNFRRSRVLANGPLRVLFELEYPLWVGDKVRGREVKRISLDAGSHFNRIESRFEVEGEAATAVAAAGSRRAKDGLVRVDREAGLLRTWEPQLRYGPNGAIGCAVVAADPVALVDVVERGGNVLLALRRDGQGRAVHYAGSGWDQSGSFADVEAWDAHVDSFARRLRAPLGVTVTAMER